MIKITFNIKYNTDWGQRIFIVGSCEELGANIIRAAKKMLYHNDGEWSLTIFVPDSTKKMDYRYIVEDKNDMRTAEKRLHHATFEYGCNSYALHDYWLSEPEDRTFYTSAFTKNLFVRHDTKTTEDNAGKNNRIIIRLSAPQTEPEQVVAVTGNQNCLGNWSTEYAPHMSDNNFPQWEICFNADEISFPMEYKFIVLEGGNNSLCYWETGENRIIRQFSEDKRHRTVINDYPLRTPERSWKACGSVIPVFSLRSEDSFGIGDIGDIKKLVDWTKMTGQHLIQVLPMNDTTCSHTWKDSYPYSAISIYALHPLYINIPMLGKLHDKKKMDFFNKTQTELNAKATVDYPSVEKIKTSYYHEYFRQEKENILRDIDFKTFITQNREWLIPYAAFSYLRDKNNTADFSEWGEYARYERKKVEILCHPDNEAYDEFLYLFFIQYTLHTQFESIAAYARQNAVVLKGDLPIGINRNSVEAWTEPKYFNMQQQTGAPPDDFSDTGQNWSFPTYNWDVMEKDGFSWWKKRFNKLACYFDCFRIDHILGFFRIWEIPLTCTEGLCGHFRPALPLSSEEIGRYGLLFDERWTKPCIHTRFLSCIFGEDENAVQHNTPDPMHFISDNFGGTVDNELYKYLFHIDAEHLMLNEFCSTQRKIRKLSEGNDDRKSQIIRDGLMRIANETLFIEDPYNTKCYHPRISAYKSYAYRELSDENRLVFDRIYHDFYFLRHNHFWKETALNRLTPLINSTDMLVCGEDLGMIPASVHEVMNRLQIFTLEIERMPKAPHNEFTDLRTLPCHSVCTTSTHDINPLRAWWKEDREKTQRYYNNILQRDGEAPDECLPEIAEQIIQNHLQSPSMLTVIPLQDWFAADEQIKRRDADSERINTPADPNNYWRYRMHITLEALLRADNFNTKIRNLISENKR
ncbi:MAG: 4-alpha-glucanotransferase [Tannerella sp.]|jgi:4-alpha-glucanotransferase|nr:4-alpha-glucanotransferase [Tannerella sp.]